NPSYSEEENKVLANELRAWRKTLAQQEDLPAYIIFNDATLQELVEKRPYTTHTLLQITGFGEVKVEKYGTAILSIIRRASRDQIVESAKEGLIKARNSAKAPESFRLFKTGLNPEEIAERMGLKPATIFRHLEGFVYEGSIDPNELVDSEHYRIINEIMDEIGAGMLSDIKDRAPEHIDYREIALVRAHKFRQEEEWARQYEEEEWARRNAEKEWIRRLEEKRWAQLDEEDDDDVN
ncbi:MAG: HRDC domain-containing protein, partial [Bacteroidota bacterium]|nr:HRDC domain-containing protein [Bacteroidota bacterium]MDX5430036.1 HRDC domain-containing protein [Bacteroidota bacterium]MDX5468806.1 HRDC domain-containing protein [Bacteroidota bacterium]